MCGSGMGAVQVKEQPSGINSFLPPYSFQGLKEEKSDLAANTFAH